MAGSVIPSYLAHLVVEGQGTEDTDRELRLCHVEAIEAQTAVLERIAAALEHSQGLPPVEGLEPITEADVADHKEMARRGY